MKTYKSVLLIILAISCNNPPEKSITKESADHADTTALHKSMKGFDLYAWEKDGSIFFTLLPGTNRNKTSAEIYDSTKAVEGMSAIEIKINEINSGEYVFLKAIDMDTSRLNPLIEYMKNKNLNVTVKSQTVAE